MRQCETSRAAKALPPKVLQREDGPLKTSESREERLGEEREGGDFFPPEASWWNNHAFKAMQFSDRHFSFPDNFPDEYQSLFDMPYAQLSDSLEV